MDNFRPGARRLEMKLQNSSHKIPDFCRFSVSFRFVARAPAGTSRYDGKNFVADLLVSRDLNKPELPVDAWIQVYYITIKDKERREMLGFLLSILLPVKLAAAAVIIYLLLRIMFG